MGNPTVLPITERRHAWGFLSYDPSGGVLSREQITIASGVGVVTAGYMLAQAGAVVGSVAALGTNTGNPTFGTINAQARDGAYAMNMEDATHFTVEDPQGVEIGHGVLGAPFAAGGIGFTAMAGGTPCVAGDSFAITVPKASWVVYDPTIAGHLGAKLGVLGSEYKDATSAAKQAAALTKGPSKVNASELIWGANVTTTNQKTAALAVLDSQGVRSV